MAINTMFVDANHPHGQFQQLVESWVHKYGPILKQRIGNEWFVFISDPNDVEKVFRNDRKYPFRGPLPLQEVYLQRSNQSFGLAMLNNEEWHTLRRPAQKSILRTKAMAKFIPIISEIADDFVKKFDDTNRVDDIMNILMEYTTEGVGKLCFNVRLGCITKGNQSVQTETMKHISTFFECFSDQLHVFPWYRYFQTPFYKRFATAADHLYSLADSNILKHTKRLTDQMNDDDDPSLLQDMLSNPDMTPQQIRSTLLDVFVGGIDSTAVNGTTLFCNLAKNVDKQDKLFEELKKYVPRTGPIDESILRNLVYLKGCVKESMRLVFPVAVGTLRQLDKDIELKGFNIPAHCLLTGVLPPSIQDVCILEFVNGWTNIQFCSGIVCKDPAYYKDPDEFIPERWLRDNEQHTTANAFSFLPFGFGPRKCVGQLFAETEIYICAAKMLRNYRLTMPADQHTVSYVDKTFRTPAQPVSFLIQRR